MAFTIKYATLCKIKVLHRYYLDRGGRPFDGLSDREQERVLDGFDASNVFRFVPTPETAQLMRGRSIVMRSTSEGIRIGVRVDNQDHSKPAFSFDQAFSLHFAVYQNDPNFLNFSGLPLGEFPGTPNPLDTRFDPQPLSAYGFSNRTANEEDGLLFVSRPLTPLDASRSYQAGDLRVDNEQQPTELFQAVRYEVPGGTAIGWQGIRLAPAYQDPATDYKQGDVVEHNGSLFTAVRDPQAAPPSAADWLERPITFQYASYRDQLHIVPATFSIDLRDLATAQATLKLRRAGESAVVFDEVQPGNPVLPFFSADFRDLEEGLYDVELLNVGGQAITDRIPAQVYLSNDLYRSRPFGIMMLDHDPSGGLGAFGFLDGATGALQSPNYHLRFSNRCTFWRFIFNPGQTIDTGNLSDQLQEDQPAGERVRLSSVNALSLTREVREVHLDNNKATLLPNPNVQLVRLDKEDGRVYSEIYV